MDTYSWISRLSATSKRHQTALRSRPGTFMGFEEMDGNDDFREEFPCPFCAGSYDILSLCCHIEDEHPLERKRKSRKKGSHSTLSLLRRELKEGKLQSLLGVSSCFLPSSNGTPDSLLSSFISPMTDHIFPVLSPSSNIAPPTKKTSKR